jgi:hypothetical protein
VTGEGRELHNEELHDRCPSSDIVTMIKSKKLRLKRHVACTVEARNAYKTLNSITWQAVTWKT